MRLKMAVKEIQDRFSRENYRRVDANFSELDTRLLALEETPVRAALTDVQIDFENSFILTKTIAQNTTLKTFLNPKLMRTVILEITGNFTLAFPSGVTTVRGTYDGTKTNWVYFTCVDELNERYIARIYTAP